MKLLLILLLSIPLGAQEAPKSSPDDPIMIELRTQVQRVQDLSDKIAAKDSIITYWRTQFHQMFGQLQAMQLEQNRIWACLAKDGIPGYDPNTGDPTCTSRPKPDKEPAKP